VPIVDTSSGLLPGESLVLDPSEVASGRTEVDLHSDNILVREEGPDWGDSLVAAYMAESQIGEIPVDFRTPNRKVTIPLMLLTSGGPTFDDAREDLQAKVAMFQQEGGWLKRELRDGRKLYLDVINATLKMGGGTHQAQHDLDPAVNLELETLPDWYGDEVDKGEFVVTADGELVALLEDIEGNYPGRFRIEVDNDDATNPQLGLIAAVRCRHYSGAATAAPAYEAEDLTPLDTAAAAALTGASGGNVVEHDNLGTSWTPVLDLDLDGVGPLTHTGTCRVLARVHSTSATPPQIRLVRGLCDLTTATPNPTWEIPAADNFYIADLGEVRLDPPPVGTHCWKGIIQGKGDAGGENVSIDKVWVLGADEGYTQMAASIRVEQGLDPLIGRDEFNQAAGDLAGKNDALGVAWAEAGASDLVVEDTGHTVQRTTTGDNVDAVSGAYAISGASAVAAQVVQIDVMASAAAPVLMQAALARYTDVNNWLRAELLRSTGIGAAEIRVWKRVGGTAEIIGRSAPFDTAVDTWDSIRLLVDTAGRYVVWFSPQGADPGDPVVIGHDADLATGGDLEDGKPGFYDSLTVGGPSTRQYDNFACWVPTLDAVVHPSRSAELRSDGCFREDSAGAAYGPIVPDGDLLRLPPSTLEARPVEVFLKWSRGDFDQLPDSGIDDGTARLFYRPSWSTVPTV
jgi:hypothetical protein